MAPYSRVKRKLLLVKFLEDSRKRRMEQQQKIPFLLEAKRMFLLRVFLVTALLVSSENAVDVRSCR